MKITSIETFPVEIQIKPERRMISALGRHEVSRYLIVRLRTDAGIDGVGEATVMPRWSGETVWSAKALVEHVLRPLLIGRDPADIAGVDAVMDQACAHNQFTKSAIEMACWDILGKSLGASVHTLLGGACRPLVFRCRFSMGAYDLDRARRTAQERVAAGFETIKVKVGGDIAADVARVRAVRETIGESRNIVIDANGGWTADQAITAITQMAPLRICLAEQPTPVGDYTGMRRVRQATGVPVMADDTCFDLVHAQELLRGECCDVISVYPGKNGGIRKCVEIIRLAQQHGVGCAMGSNLELDIATSAMCQVVAACQNLNAEAFPGDVLGPIYHEARIAKNPVAIAGDKVTVPAGPGLGIEVDWEAVSRSLFQVNG